MWRNHYPKLKLNKIPHKNLMFHNDLAWQGFSFCNKACLNFQAFALHDMTMAAWEGCRVGQKMSYRFSFC